ncbi:hypothetical protein STENM327S_09381 [Streptomyces tendae]
MASPLVWLDRSGDQLLFYVRALLWIPRTLRRYLKEVQRLLAEVAFGSGGLGVLTGRCPGPPPGPPPPRPSRTSGPPTPRR